MGLFKKIADVSSEVLKGAGEVMVYPAARELERPVVSVIRSVQSLIPGGKTGQEAVQTPFGEVKPYSALTPKEAVKGAIELAVSTPGAAVKFGGVAVKTGAKILGSLAAKAGTETAKLLKQSAITGFEQALAPTTQKLKKATEKITPRALEMGVKGTLGQISKFARKGLQKAGQEIEEFGELKGSVQVQKLLDIFSDARKEFEVEGVLVNETAGKVINKISNTAKKLSDDTGEVSLEALRGLRRIWDNEVAQAGGFLGKTLKEGSEIEIKKIGSNAIRNLLAEEVPDLAKINANYNFFKNLSDIAEATKLRKIGQTGIVRKAAGALVGVVVGRGAGLPGAEAAGAWAGSKIAQIGGSTLFKSLSANAKFKVADALLDGKHSIERVVSFFSKTAFPVVKVKDIKNFLNKEAKKTETEIKKEQEEHELQINSLRQELLGVTIETPEEHEQRIQSLREELLKK